MVYAVQGQFGFRTVNKRDTVMSLVQTRLSQKVKWGVTTAQTMTTMAGDPGMIVEVRFENEADRDAFWTDVIAAMGTGLNGPVTGSSIWQHDCPHDGASPGPCVISERRDY